MCGVIGVHLDDVYKEDLELVKSLFLQSMIRGKHATGVTYLSCGKLHTFKEPISADKFIEKYDPREFVDPATMNMTFIGHTRYSTSDLRYNQPFQGKETAIAHNGVISQDPDVWEYKTETLNDSELILRCIEAGDTPLEVYKNRSMAVVVIDGEELCAFRNHERPLWMAKRKHGVIFASTRDIMRRAGIRDNITRCEPMVKYSYSKNFGFHVDRTYFDPELEDLQ
jgi:glutamine phosphoribosylpyrophosphate amidotransferase